MEAWHEGHMKVPEVNPELRFAARLCIDGTVRQLTDDELALVMKYEKKLAPLFEKARQIGDFQARWALERRRATQPRVTTVATSHQRLV